MDAHSSVRSALTPVAIGSLLFATGCQGLMRSVGLDTGANEANHEEVRTLLSTGQYESAFERIGPEGDAAPTDVALWLLYQGTVARHAGRYEESAEALDLAHYVSEARYTRRIGTGLFSLITNDRVLPYVPDRTERLLIHYYAALDYLMMDQPLEAAVEARRLSFMLERYADEPPLRDHADLVVHMRLVAGLIFQSAGETNDAAVAFRLAYAAAEGSGRGLIPAVAAANPSATAVPADMELNALLTARSPAGLEEMPPDSMGEVIVLIERGFIAPRVQGDMELALWEHELEAVGIASAVTRAGTATCIADYVMRNADPLSLGGRIETDDDEVERCVPVPDDWDERQRKNREERENEDSEGPDGYEHDGRPLPAPTVGRPPATVVKGTLEPPAPKNPAAVRGPADPGDEPGDAGDAGEPRSRASAARSVRASGPGRQYIRLALPTYPNRAAGLASVPSRAVLSVGGMDRMDVSLPIDLSACVMDEFAQDVPFVLAKTIARAAARQALARGLSETGSGDGEVLAEVLGFLVGAVGDAMERADTRSWNLLPASLGITRLRLPVGEHSIVIDGANSGPIPGCDLGTVRVEAGRTPILSCRVWN